MSKVKILHYPTNKVSEVPPNIAKMFLRHKDWGEVEEVVMQAEPEDLKIHGTVVVEVEDDPLNEINEITDAQETEEKKETETEESQTQAQLLNEDATAKEEEKKRKRREYQRKRRAKLKAEKQKAKAEKK